MYSLPGRPHVVINNVNYCLWWIPHGKTSRCPKLDQWDCFVTTISGRTGLLWLMLWFFYEKSRYRMAGPPLWNLVLQLFGWLYPMFGGIHMVTFIFLVKETETTFIELLLKVFLWNYVTSIYWHLKFLMVT